MRFYIHKYVIGIKCKKYLKQAMQCSITLIRNCCILQLSIHLDKRLSFAITFSILSLRSETLCNDTNRYENQIKCRVIYSKLCFICWVPYYIFTELNTKSNYDCNKRSTI